MLKCKNNPLLFNPGSVLDSPLFSRRERSLKIVDCLRADRIKAAAIEKRCAENPPSLRELHTVLRSGSPEERIGYSSSFLRPEFYAANQDFVLAALTRAAHGSAAERRFYEEHRLLMEANAPAWFRAHCRAVKSFRPSLLEENKDMALAGCATFAFAGDFVAKKASRIPYRRSIGHEREIMERMKGLLAVHLIEDLSALHNLPWGDNLKVWVWEGIRINPWKIGRTNAYLDTLEKLNTARPDLSDEKFHEECARIFESKKNYFDWLAEKEARRKEQRLAKKTAAKAAAPLRHEEQPEQHSDRVNQAQELRKLRYSIAAAIRINFPEIQSTRDYARSLVKLSGASFGSFMGVAERLNAGVHPEQLIVEMRRHRRSSLNGHGRQTKSLKEETVSSSLPDARITEHRRHAIRFSDEARETLERDGRWRLAVEHELEKLALAPTLTRRRKVATTTDVWELKLHSPAVRVYYYRPGEHVISVLHVGSKGEQEHDVLRLEHLRDKAEQKRRSSEN